MWQPISEEKILDMIDDAEWLMEPHVRYIWNQIKIAPQKWQHSPWGDLGGGFWVVAVLGQSCIYYNDIEDGFNVSAYEQFGSIKEYRCNHTDLLSYLNVLTQNLINGKSIKTE